MSKVKGSNAERELVKMFWSNGWASLRTAGSGSSHFPSPDILAANKIRRLAIEVKSTKHSNKYFPPKEIQQLLNFSNYFGAEPWIGIKFSQTWVFVNPEDLRQTKASFIFTTKDIENKGIEFKQLINS